MNALYHQIIEHAESNENSDVELARKVWDPTPWVLEVYLGDVDGSGFYLCWDEMRDWCNEHFGVESWPLHGRPGNWYSGSAVVDGWTWIGFDTEEHMKAFIAAWPNNVEIESEASDE